MDCVLVLCSRAVGVGDLQSAHDYLMKRNSDQLSDDHRAVINALKVKLSESNQN